MSNLENAVTLAAKPLKKSWAQPQLVLISTNQIASKHFLSVHEGTGHNFPNGTGLTLWLTPGNKAGFILTASGAKVGNVSSAIS